jgi:hypothetical protein
VTTVANNTAANNTDPFRGTFNPFISILLDDEPRSEVLKANRK